MNGRLGGGRLGRGEFARLAYVLGRRQLSGTLIIHERSLEHRVVIRRGYLTSIHVAGHFAPLGRMLRDQGAITSDELKQSLEQLAGSPALQGRVLTGMGAVSPDAVRVALERQAVERLERLAAMPEAQFVLREPVSADLGARGGVPMALAPWAWAHLRARFAADPRAARRQCLALAREEVRLEAALAPGLVEGASALERRLVGLLADAGGPVRFDQLGATAVGAAAEELLAAIAALATVGAMVPDRSAWRRAFDGAGARAGYVAEERRGTGAGTGTGTGMGMGTGMGTGMGGGERVAEGTPPHGTVVAPSARGEALRRLGLSPSASQLEIKQAFRRLARTLHPDTHPRADAPTRRRLEQRFAEVAGAYREALSPPRH